MFLCTEAFLEDDATVDAEIFVNKASALINDVEDWALQLRYRTAFARILDANRKFVEAASRYYELSTMTNQQINRDDLLQLLAKAATCAVLGKTSAQRTRIIGLICKVGYYLVNLMHLLLSSDDVFVVFHASRLVVHDYIFTFFIGVCVILFLFQDERLSELSSAGTEFAAHASLLRRVHRQQLLPAAEVLVFESSLMPHQKAVRLFVC